MMLKYYRVRKTSECKKVVRPTLELLTCKSAIIFRPAIISCQQNPRLAITFFSFWRHNAFRKFFMAGNSSERTTPFLCARYNQLGCCGLPWDALMIARFQLIQRPRELIRKREEQLLPSTRVVADGFLTFVTRCPRNKIRTFLHPPKKISVIFIISVSSCTRVFFLTRRMTALCREVAREVTLLWRSRPASLHSYGLYVYTFVSLWTPCVLSFPLPGCTCKAQLASFISFIKCLHSFFKYLIGRM